MSATERVSIALKALAGLEADNDERTNILSRENGKIRFEAFIDLAVFSGRFRGALFPTWCVRAGAGPRMARDRLGLGNGL